MLPSKKFRKVLGTDWRRAPASLGGVLVTKSGHGNQPSTWHFFGGADTVWLLLDGRRSIEALTAEIARLFPGAKPYSDITAFLEFLLEQQLVEEVPSPSEAR